MAPPHLQPPGAGLPFIPRIYLRWFGRRVLRWKYSWDSAPIAIGATAERLYRAVANLPADVLQRPALVPPMPGIEDSSRYWSPAMVIQHLNMTCEIFTGIIVKLSRGEAISERRGPADVKPAPDAGRVDIESFQSLHTGVGERICAEAGPGAISLPPSVVRPVRRPLDPAREAIAGDPETGAEHVKREQPHRIRCGCSREQI